MTTRTQGTSEGTSAIMPLRRDGAVEQPDQITLGMGARGRQILAGKYPAQNVALAGAVDDEQHFARRRQRRKGQRHAGYEWLPTGLGNADHPALLLVERGLTGIERRTVAVRADAHEHEVEQRPRRIELFGAVKFLERILINVGRS